MNPAFWKNKKVLITGHTGFKGSWLTIWLKSLGAEIVGYSLSPTSEPNLFNVATVSDSIIDIRGDIRNQELLESVIKEHEPEILIHMAAQSLVRLSYSEPIETYSTNVMGTLHLLEAVRSTSSVKTVINVTTDKCYENREWVWSYRENEAMGGYDPYSSSKACSELLTAAYRNSFFNSNKSKVLLASVRAGNVIGGGDWSKDRLIPDIIKSIECNEPVLIRNPSAIRPWQHVLEPLNGYLTLAEKLHGKDEFYADAWNFGPNDNDAKPVSWIVDNITKYWGEDASWVIDHENHPHEATYLKLDYSKAKSYLDWEPKWNLQLALSHIIDWYKAYLNKQDMHDYTLKQINNFMNES